MNSRNSKWKRYARQKNAYLKRLFEFARNWQSQNQLLKVAAARFETQLYLRSENAYVNQIVKVDADMNAALCIAGSKLWIPFRAYAKKEYTTFQ